MIRINPISAGPRSFGFMKIICFQCTKLKHAFKGKVLEKIFGAIKDYLFFFFFKISNETFAFTSSKIYFSSFLIMIHSKFSATLIVRKYQASSIFSNGPAYVT